MLHNGTLCTCGILGNRNITQDAPALPPSTPMVKRQPDSTSTECLDKKQRRNNYPIKEHYVMYQPQNQSSPFTRSGMSAPASCARTRTRSSPALSTNFWRYDSAMTTILSSVPSIIRYSNCTFFCTRTDSMV